MVEARWEPHERSSLQRARSIVVVFVFALSLAQALAQPAPSVSACASQLTGKPVSDPGAAQNIVSQFARKLYDGTSGLNALEPGHKLYCRDDQGHWRNMSQLVRPLDQALHDRVLTAMSRVDEAARILGLEGTLASAIERRGFGRQQAVLSIGPLKRDGPPAIFVVAYNLPIFNTNSQASIADAAVHEVLGHFMQYLSCPFHALSTCKANPFTLVWSVIMEADANAKTFAFIMYETEIRSAIPSDFHLGARAYDGATYLSITTSILLNRPDLKQRMRSDGRVPRELLVLLLEEFALRPPAYYLTDAIRRNLEFGKDKDLTGSLESVVGYLGDPDRQRIRDQFRASPLHKALKVPGKLDSRTLDVFLISPKSLPH